MGAYWIYGIFKNFQFFFDSFYNYTQIKYSFYILSEHIFLFSSFPDKRSCLENLICDLLELDDTSWGANVHL